MKRRILSMLLVVVLVMTMTVTAFAGSQQADITYKGKVYTVYARCELRSATANIRTTDTSSVVSVSCIAYDNVGTHVLGDNSGISEAIVTIGPAGNRTFEDMTATYYVSGQTIDSRTVTP